MVLLGIAVAAQLAVAARPVRPVLTFPERGLDDPAAYQGYQTRFFRDVAGNTVQIYIDGRSGRVVHLLADAEDESIAFTVRDASGRSPALKWSETKGARVWRDGRFRTFEYALVADAPRIDVGLFLLGSMRVERDFQYANLHRGKLSAPAYVVPELQRMVAALDRVDAAARREGLASFNARDGGELRARMRPVIAVREKGSEWTARIVQASLDGRDTLVCELSVDRRRVDGSRDGDTLSLAARSGAQVPFSVRVSTTARALTPLTRAQIFSGDFLRFLAAAHTDSTSTRSRWLERNVRGVELLASREKLMAGLPAYATYFGRDMLVSALMMRPIWRDEISELVIASVLRKLSPTGQVSHEEALGGQAAREAAAEYATLIDQYVRARDAGRAGEARQLLAHANGVLRDHARTRENYHMIDNLFQLPVLAGRWLADPNVPAARKRAFLLDSSDGDRTRLVRLQRELALVAGLAKPYADDPAARNLVSFAPRDSGRWASASWRDSDVGYAGGRYAMDVNAVWVPHALQSIERIVTTLDELGLRHDSLPTYVNDPRSLRRAIDAWSGAWRHFVMRLGPDEVRTHVAARVDAMPANDRAAWKRVLTETHADRDSLVFLALALDGNGRPIGVANTDPATGLFLGEDERATTRRSAAPDAMSAVLRDVRLFGRAYPVGLFIDSVGPVVANDAYATPAVWAAFDRDRYHSPHVVWDREVNLFALGVMNHIAEARARAPRAYVAELESTLTRVLGAAHASGFHSELWSYEVSNGRAVPLRYGTGSDVQLWSTTDLVVEYMLHKLGTRDSGLPSPEKRIK
jgi:hypothetical protein